MLQMKLPDPQPSAEPEALSLAYELVKAYRGMVSFYTKYEELTPEEAVAKVESMTPDPRQMERPLQEASWYDIEQLIRHDPEGAVKLWGAIKQGARDELQSGWRGAQAVEGFSRGPWQRAQYLAIRASLIEQWQPAGGIELILIESMAQAHTLYLDWVHTLATQLNTEFERRKGQYDKDGYLEPPRVSTYQALEQSVGMVDRFNRMFLRNLRQLRDLRRYTQAVTIQSAGQVNIGGQQLNMARVEQQETDSDHN